MVQIRALRSCFRVALRTTNFWLVSRNERQRRQRSQRRSLARSRASSVQFRVDLRVSPLSPLRRQGPHHGKWFDELREGMVIPHALTRTVTETDNLLFTTLSLNPAKLHLDYESAKSTPFGKPLVNSMFTVALLVGITVLETTHGTTIANLGFEERRGLSPQVWPSLVQTSLKFGRTKRAARLSCQSAPPTKARTARVPEDRQVMHASLSQPAR